MAWVDLTPRKTRSMSHLITWSYPIGGSSTTSYYSQASFSGTLGYKVQYDDTKDLTDANSMRVAVDMDCSLSMRGNNCPDAGSGYVNVAVLSWGGTTGSDSGNSNLYNVGDAINQVKNYRGGTTLLAAGASDAQGGAVSVPNGSYSGTQYITFSYNDLNSSGKLTVKLPLRHKRKYLDSENGLTTLVSSNPASTWISVDLSDLKLIYFPWAIKQSGTWNSTDRDDDYTNHVASPSKAGLRIKRNNVWDACVNTTEYETGVDHGLIKRSGSWKTSILHGND